MADEQRLQQGSTDLPRARTRSGRFGATPQQNHRSTALFRRYRATRDRALRDEIVTRHLALARHVARHFDTSRVAFDDLVQVASIGLIKAVDRYDPAYGTTFATFAVPTIRGEILRYFRDHTWGVRPPRNLQERALELIRASDEMVGEAGQRPSAVDLAERVGATVDDVLEGLYAAGARDGDSMERLADDQDGAAPRRDTLGAEDSEFDRVDHGVTAQLLMTQLTALERRVLHLRFHQDLTQSDVARLLDTNQMQVSRIQRRAMDKLSEIAADAPGFDAGSERHALPYSVAS